VSTAVDASTVAVAVAVAAKGGAITGAEHAAAQGMR